jgi:ribulose-phosphate 3-epimerase
VAAETVERCAEAGADVFVAGSAVYDADDPVAAVEGLRQQAAAASAGSWWGQH